MVALLVRHRISKKSMEDNPTTEIRIQRGGRSVIRPLVYYPNNKLYLKSAKVEEIDLGITTLLDDLAETMYDRNGMGISAIQIGVPLRILMVSLPSQANRPDLPHVEFINPEIVDKSKQMVSLSEGCLSIPGVSEILLRHQSVTVRAQDRKGDFFKVEIKDLLAVCVQHEMDHLEGELFIDKLSPLKKKFAMKNYRGRDETDVLSHHRQKGWGSA